MSSMPPATLPAVIEGEIIEPEDARSRALVPQADTDRHLVDLWLGRHASRGTRCAYREG